MTSAGKWVLGLLLLVVGAVFVARSVSTDVQTGAEVKNLSPAAVAGASKDSAAAAGGKRVAAVAADLACKKACVEVNEVSNDSITTAKLAPGSVTLSKLAFEVPNLNELHNEINARKAAEVAAKAADAETKAALAETASANAKNDASITAAAANGLAAEAAARTAAIDDLGKKAAAADADIVSKLNKEVADRGAADDVLQAKLNTEIADRAGAISNLRSELANPNEVGAPIVKINNNEIVADAITTDKIAARTILSGDLAVGAVTSTEILNRTIKAEDLGDAAVVGRAAGESLTNVKELSLRGQRNNNLSGGVTTTNGDIALGTITGDGGGGPGGATGNIALGTITGEADNDAAAVSSGNLALGTVGRANLVNGAVDTAKLDNAAVTTAKLSGADVDSAAQEVTGDVTRAVTAGKIRDDAVITRTIKNGDVTETKLRSVDGSGAGGAVSTEKINDRAVTSAKLANVDGSEENGAVTTDKITKGAVTASKLADVNSGTGVGGAVGTSKIDKGAVTFEKLADVDPGSGLGGAVTTSKIDKGAVTFEKLAATAVRGGKDGVGAPNNIVDGSITDDDLHASAGVSGGKLKNGSVTSEKLSVDDTATTTADEAAVATANLQKGAVTNDRLGTDISADKLSTGFLDVARLSPNSITGAKLALASDKRSPVSATPTGIQNANIEPGTIEADRLVTASTNPSAPGRGITAAQLEPNSVTALQIGSGQVTTTELLANAKSIRSAGGALNSATVTADYGSATGTALTITDDVSTATHTVLVSGQAFFTCSCDGTDVATVTWQLVDTTLTPVEIGPSYTAKATASSPMFAMPYSFVHDAAPVGARHYKLRVTFTGVTGSESGATIPTGLVDTVVINAVDLGRTAPPVP